MKLYRRGLSLFMLIPLIVIGFALSSGLATDDRNLRALGVLIIALTGFVNFAVVYRRWSHGRLSEQDSTIKTPAYEKQDDTTE